jgi:head-to-tail connecting protein
MAKKTAGGSREKRSEKERYEQLRASLLNERASFEPSWRELGDFLMPRRMRFQVSDKNKGDRRNQNIIDSTPRFSARTLQSGLHAGLTSPARPWLRLTTPDENLAEYPTVKAWLHEVTQRMLAIFLKSNLYNALPTLYGDMSVFATAAMAVLEDSKDMMRAYSYPIGSYAIGLDARGVASTFLRDYSPTVRQVVEDFGVVPGTTDIDWRNISRSVKDRWDRGDYESAVEVTWLVLPNIDYNPKATLDPRRAKPFRSCHFERGRESDVFLRLGGFREFPVLVPRWDVTAEDVYGTDCPGVTAIGDVKSLQIMHRRSAKAIDKALDPPLQGPTSLRTQKTSLLPGDITYLNEGREGQGLRPIHEVQLAGVAAIEQKIRDTQYRIQRAFYEDLFLMMARADSVPGQPVTAREIEERHEEKLLALGPVLERTNDELLDPLIDRTFAMMLDKGTVPPPPDELAGMDLKVEYISLMSQAQKLVGVVGQDRFLQSVTMLAQTFPDVRHKVNVFYAVDTYANMLGVAPKLVLPDDTARQTLDAERQALAEQQRAEQLKHTAGAMRDLGQTSMDDNTALRAIVGGAGSAVS